MNAIYRVHQYHSPSQLYYCTIPTFIYGRIILKSALIRSAVGGSRRSAVVPNAMPEDLTPWEAGAIGTLAGGMAGYELGREEMERQNRERIQQQMFNNNNNGNFGGGNIGGGS